MVVVVVVVVECLPAAQPTASKHGRHTQIISIIIILIIVKGCYSRLVARGRIAAAP